jgi:TRAP-type C4-dicarboxylate transport system permease small subunit
VQLFQAAVFAISRMAAALACLSLIFMVGHILYEIVLRYVFSTSTFVLDEFVGYAVAATTFMALGYALHHGSLIRVNILIGRTTGGLRRALEALSAIATLAVVSLLIWSFWLRVSRHWGRGTVSSSIAQVPMWIPEGAVLLGLAVFWLQLFAYFLRSAGGGEPPGSDQDLPPG